MFGDCYISIIELRNLITFNRFLNERIDDIFDKITNNFLKVQFVYKKFQLFN